MTKKVITEKRRNAISLLLDISVCKTEADLELMNDLVEESMMTGCITKKDYKILGEELDDRLSYLVSEGLI